MDKISEYQIDYVARMEAMEVHPMRGLPVVDEQYVAVQIDSYERTIGLVEANRDEPLAVRTITSGFGRPLTERDEELWLREMRAMLRLWRIELAHLQTRRIMHALGQARDAVQMVGPHGPLMHQPRAVTS